MLMPGFLELAAKSFVKYFRKEYVMSRVGKNPIHIPDDVTFVVNGSELKASGKFGSNSYSLSDLVSIRVDSSVIHISPISDNKRSRVIWGTDQRQVQNLIRGVSQGFNVTLDLVGVGYRASVQQDKICVQLGFSHDVLYHIPKNIIVKCEKPTSISITGPSKQLVGQIASEIRKMRKPEPYKGKGVIREGEFVIRKEGKKK